MHSDRPPCAPHTLCVYQEINSSQQESGTESFFRTLVDLSRSIAWEWLNVERCNHKYFVFEYLQRVSKDMPHENWAVSRAVKRSQ